MEERVVCGCGAEFRGTDDELAGTVIKLGKDRQMDVTREQALAQAKPV